MQGFLSADIIYSEKRTRAKLDENCEFCGIDNVETCMVFNAKNVFPVQQQPDRFFKILHVQKSK